MRLITKICLIDPTTLNDKWEISTHSMREPLGLECLGAFLEEHGYDVCIIQQNMLSDDDIVNIVIEYGPQVIGFTSFSYNFRRAHELAKKIKNVNPNFITIFGGYHITFCLNEVKDPAIDFIVRGEGEQTTLELINALNNDRDFNDVRGIVYFNGKEVVKTADRNRIKNLDILPFATRSHHILKNLKVDGLMYPPPTKQINPALIFASRGCPYKCQYCASPNFHGSYVSYRSPEKIVEEMIFLKNNFGTNVLYFTDLTFNLSKKFVKNLCAEIIKKNTGDIYWYALCRPENIDEESVKLMKEAGCTKIGFGIDSVSEKILKKLDRDIDIRKINEIFQIVSSFGIIVRANIMFGFPWDTIDIYESTLEVLTTLFIDEIRIALFSPYPGTEFYKKYKNNISNFNYDSYDSQTPLIKTSNLDLKDISLYAYRVYEKFYTSSKYKNRIKYKEKNHNCFKVAFDEFEKDLLNKLHNLKLKYNVM